MWLLHHASERCTALQKPDCIIMYGTPLELIFVRSFPSWDPPTAHQLNMPVTDPSLRDDHIDLRPHPGVHLRQPHELRDWGTPGSSSRDGCSASSAKALERLPQYTGPAGDAHG